jgi:hypothetical protein
MDLLNGLIQRLERASPVEIWGENVSCRTKDRTEGKLFRQRLLDHDGHVRDIPDQEKHIEEAGMV